MRSQHISTKENSKLSSELDKLRVPKHIAIIMDGNGRWAIKKVFQDHLVIIKELAY